MIYDDVQARKDLREHSPTRTIYYVFLLKKGPAWRGAETPEIETLQQEHIANLTHLEGRRKLVLNGHLLDSFATSGELRGIGIIRADSLPEAQVLISTDPMIKLGRLTFELHTWMVRKNVLP